MNLWRSKVRRNSRAKIPMSSITSSRHTVVSHDQPDRGSAARGRKEGRRKPCVFTPVRTVDRRTCGHDQKAREPGTGEAVGFLTRRVASRSRAFGEITLSIRYMEINSGVSFRHHSAARKKTFGHRISIINMWSKTRYIRGLFLIYQD